MCISIRLVAIGIRTSRNEYVVRTKKTIKSFLKTDRFGMKNYGIEQRKRALYDLTQDGLVRLADNFKVVKPLLHAMSLKREQNAREQYGQSDNMGKYVRDKEFVELNGKLVEEVMLPSDVAMLILVIDNLMGVKDNEVSKKVDLLMLLLYLTVTLFVCFNRKEKQIVWKSSGQ